MAGIQIYTANGVTKVFELYGVEQWSYNEAKTLESLDIPGLIWNPYFDSVIVKARLTIVGKFQAEDKTWDTTTFTGRGFDFMHNLRSVLKSIAPADNAYSTTVKGGSYLGDNFSIFQIDYVETLDSGTYYWTPTNTGYYTAPDGTTGATIFYVYSSGDFKVVGGSPGLVEYTLEFLELAAGTATDALVRLA